MQLSIDDTRVVDLGLVPTYQRWYEHLAGIGVAKRFANFFVPNLCVPYDSRMLTLLWKDLIELTVNGLDNIFTDAYDTATVWQVVRPRAGRSWPPGGAHGKRLYKFGCNAGVTQRDLFYFDEVDLLWRPRTKFEQKLGKWPVLSDLKC